MKKILMSAFLLVCVSAAAVAQQKPDENKKQVEAPKVLEPPTHKKSAKSTQNESKTAEQKKLEHFAKLEAAKNKKPVAAETKTEADN